MGAKKEWINKDTWTQPPNGDIKEILKRAEDVSKELGFTVGSWYVTYAKGMDERDLEGYFLMSWQPYSDDAVMISLKTMNTYYVNTARFRYIQMIGAVRDGRASDKVWKTSE